MDKNYESKANKEYKELLRERTYKVMERDRELHDRGLPVGLDGPNYYQDIDDWFDSCVEKIKEKYRITK